MALFAVAGFFISLGHESNPATEIHSETAQAKA